MITPPTGSLIFPGSNPTVDLQIVDCLIKEKDIRSVVILSGVNKEAYEFFPNEAYFKELFTFMHPALMTFDDSPFPLICQELPNNCWKLLACSSVEGKLLLNKTFLKSTAVPIFCNALIKDKERTQIEIENICGSGPQDPKSPFHIARQAAEQAAEYKYEQLALRRSGVRNEEGICLESNYYDTELKSAFPSPFSRIATSRCLCKLCSSIKHANDCRHKYCTLDLQRLRLTEKVKNISNEIDLLRDPYKFLESTSINFYKDELITEFDESIKLSRQLLVPGLCINLIDEFREGKLKSTPLLGSQFLAYLHSFNPKLHKDVFSQLLDICNKENTPKQYKNMSKKELSEWFRQHFPECLGELRSLLCSNIKRIVKNKIKE
jgi:hypothetical protein